MDKENNKGYGKRPLWQWILIYSAFGLVVYGLINYFVIAKKDVNSSSSAFSTIVMNSPEASASPTQTQNRVVLTTNGFTPNNLIIKAGTEVKWVNNSGAIATVHSDPHPQHTDYSSLNLGNFPDAGTLAFTFNEPGTYNYHNHLNPGQRGTILVQ